MSSLSEKQKQVLRKVITKKNKKPATPVNPSKTMTRFRSKAKNCGICYSAIETQGLLSSCQHEFCFPCIEKWSQTENTCPVCKQRFSKLKKIWNRPFYGKKQPVNPNQSLPLSKPEPDAEKEINIPTRNQGQGQGQTNHEANTFFVEQLLNIMLTTLPRLTGNEDFSIEILFHESTSNVTTTFLPISLSSFFNLE